MAGLAKQTYSSALILFPLLMAILSVKPQFTIKIIAQVPPLALVVVVGDGGCCKIFDI